MRFFFIPITFLCVFFLGCSTTPEAEPASAPAKLNLSQWDALINAKAVYALDKDHLPPQVYVFPPLRLNQGSQAMDALAYKLRDDGALYWTSPAPHAAEIQAVIERKLETKGFEIISFQELTNIQEDHRVLVFNPYYVAAYQPVDRVNEETGWSSFVRVTVSTFPADLNPQQKIDVMNQEALTLYQSKASEYDVVKRSLSYLLDYMGNNKEWSGRLTLLN